MTFSWAGWTASSSAGRLGCSGWLAGGLYVECEIKPVVGTAGQQGYCSIPNSQVGGKNRVSEIVPTP